MLRGTAADVAWRGTVTGLHRSALRIALGVALVLALPLVGMALSDGVVWSLADFVLAGVLLTTIGVVIELALQRAGNRVVAVGIAGLGVACALLGGSDDAPGLVLLGLVLVAAACALAVRARAAQ